MIEKINDDEVWKEFLDHKLTSGFLNKYEKRELSRFVQSHKYRSITEKILNDEYVFSIPTRKEINKIGKKKKRVVYTFLEDENVVLKFIAYLLYEYDDKNVSNCYSFRRNIGVKAAFTNMRSIPGIEQLCCFKTDISDYFNSIDFTILSVVMEQVIEDPRMLKLLKAILSDGRALWKDEIITEQKGAMAGTPISPFLANIYLMEMDRYFRDHNIHYARYADDIIIFDTEENIGSHIKKVHDFFEQYKLSYNPEKEVLTPAGETWTFLGFQYKNGETDISAITAKKLMDKIRRKARAIRRWKIEKNVPDDKALLAFNRKWNKKLFQEEDNGELCWARWYFPVITTDRTLQVIDNYMQQYQRYLVTGKHNKSTYAAVPYRKMRENGYRPLVPEYDKYYKKRHDGKRQ